jgi:hypothetical protein
MQRRATDAGIKTKIGNHTFRATGITAYLKNKGPSEWRSTSRTTSRPRTTKLYHWRQDEISLDEVGGLRSEQFERVSVADLQPFRERR